MTSRRPIQLPENPALVELSRLESVAKKYQSYIKEILKNYGITETPDDSNLPYLMSVMNLVDISAKDVLEKGAIVHFLQEQYLLIDDYVDRLQEAKKEVKSFEFQRKSLLSSTMIEVVPEYNPKWTDSKIEELKIEEPLPMNRSIIKAHIKKLSNYIIDNNIKNDEHQACKDLQTLENHLEAITDV